MAEFLRQTGRLADASVRAILVISAHWDADIPTVLSAEHHSLYFDYYGFPEHTYQLKYLAKGSPAVAACVTALLKTAGITSATEKQRGLDHGVFIPFMQMFPRADIPIVQLSLCSNMDPLKHIAIGKALEPLRDEGVLIIGSGMSYHNMREFMQPGDSGIAAAEFDKWLTATITDPDSTARNQDLGRWRTAPHSKSCHPDPEHLLPLHVVAGAAGEDIGRQVYRDQIVGKAISGYQFGQSTNQN
ncbi:4,5-DOPA dioxygenase extradiol [Paraburkholderia nemoris]|uniref:4,5-DOPA dioxygenase extradiol n=2 Tax=Paraburkholderia nemoris TaxID=2793076 RepID=A0ABN7KZI2_9BURK|nr:4,5-DOPA dioxygenase extradiol [Paraburkholderia nemoris]CAE6750490.1 4,5-DOPA dioxygenase extradiol [Paraburkholderia nemoris]